MSVSSQMSEMSISMNGAEVNLEQAIDDTFKSLQSHLNSCQCGLRNLGMCNERNDIFEVSHKYCMDIDDDVSEMLLLFKDLKSIMKQVKLKPESPEEVEWLRNFNEQKQLEKAEQKKLDAVDKQLQKK